MNIVNFQSNDPFAEQEKSVTSTIHIHIYQRTNKRYITVIKDLPYDDKKKKTFLQQMKKKFVCGGYIEENDVKLTGDHREDARSLLEPEGFNVMIHGW